MIDGTWKKLTDPGHPHQGCIKCGTESKGGFRNITIGGNVIEGCKGISLETSDGEFLEGIAITGNTMRDVYDAPLFLRLNRRNRGPRETMRQGTLRRVMISNIASSDSDSVTVSIFSGVASNLIEDVKLSNCFFGHRGLPTEVGHGTRSRPMPEWRSIHVPRAGRRVSGAVRLRPNAQPRLLYPPFKKLEMSHVEVAPANANPRPAFWLEDVHRVDFFAITAPPQLNFALHNLADLRILWSRAAKDTTLAAAGDQTL